MSRKRFIFLIVLVILILLAASGMVVSLGELQAQLAHISQPSAVQPALPSPSPPYLGATAAAASADHGLILTLVALGGVTLSVGTVAWGVWRQRRKE